MIRFQVLGQCYSMKNGKTLTGRGGSPRIVKHPKTKAFERDFLIQVPGSAKQHLSQLVAVSVWVWYPSRKQDLDCAIVYDLLQEAGVIENDRQIIEKHEFVAGIDKYSPRVVVEIKPL